MKLTYKEWMREVDKIVIETCGLDMAFLPDWLSRDAYEDGLTPAEGATMCLEEAEFDMYAD